MGTVVTSPPVTFRRARRDDRAAILSMRERSTGETQDPALWDWLFAHNTSNSQFYCQVAESDGVVVAQFAALPVRLTHLDDEVAGLAGVQMATDPRFRGRGIFTALGKELQAAVAGERPVVFGFPNVVSAPTFYEKLDWVELRPFPVLVRPLGNVREAVALRRPRLAPLARIADVLEPAGLAPVWVARRAAERSGASVVLLDDFGEWTDGLWHRLRPLLGTCAVRDADFLRWRFCASPFPYIVYGLDRGAGPVGFAVLRLREGKFADLMELMVPPGDRAGAGLLLGHAIREARSSGAVALRAMVSERHPHRAAFRRLGFLRMPARLRAAYSFGVCVLDRSAVTPNALLHIDDWYISGADLDYI